MAVDVGTIGSKPCEVSLNKILMVLQNKRQTNLATSRLFRAKRDLKKLKECVLPHDLEFYDQLLEMLRKRHMIAVDATKESLHKDAYTHLRCCMVAV